MRNEQADLEKHRAAIEQLGDPLAGGKLAVAMLFLYLFRSSALPKPVFELEEAFHQLLHVAGASGLHDLRILIREPEGRRQKAEGRRQKAEGRRQKAEGRRQKAEGRRQKAEGRRQKKSTERLRNVPCLASCKNCLSADPAACASIQCP